MKLNKTVLDLNKKIKEHNLVFLTWGNASVISPCKKKIVIKPSGINLENAICTEMSHVCLETGKLLSGKKMSVDTDIHLEIYRNFPEVNCVIHTHSKFATLMSQLKKDVHCIGTTHADYFDGTIPCVYDLSKNEIEKNYESNLGKSIVNYFNHNNIDYRRVCAALLPSHGPVVWGKSPEKALESARVLEFVSELFYFFDIYDENNKFDNVLLRKHYDRKHGSKKYYGQD